MFISHLVMILKIKNLRQSYGVHEILNIRDFEFHRGVSWIQGVNGAGKSTLFRTLAGMLPFEGTIILDQKYDLKKEMTAYLLRLNLGEAEPLYPSFLTPRDLLLFVAEAKKSPAGQMASLIQKFGIDYLDTPFGSCSSGMVKKVSLAVAFLGEPAVIILDEPLITIDTQACQNLFELINQYLLKNVSFLISSHQKIDVAEIAVAKSYILKNKTIAEV